MKATKRFKACVSRRVAIIWDISAAKIPLILLINLGTWRNIYNKPRPQHRARANRTDAVREAAESSGLWKSGNPSNASVERVQRLWSRAAP